MGNIYLGTMGWSYNFWPLYDGIKTSDYLSEYSKKFNSVEINSTFYRIPRKSSVEKWSKQTPENFMFSVKIPQSISHSSSLQYDSDKLNAFLEHIKPFGKKLGPLLLQLPPRLDSKHYKQLSIILSQLQKYRVAIEFRNKSWFNEQIYQLLKDHNTAIVHVEHPTRTNTKVVTSDLIYVRLEGDRKKVDGEKGITEIDRLEDNSKWAEKILNQKDNFENIYLFVSKYYSGYPPTDISQIKSRLEQSP